MAASPMVALLGNTSRISPMVKKLHFNASSTGPMLTPKARIFNMLKNTPVAKEKAATSQTVAKKDPFVKSTESSVVKLAVVQEETSHDQNEAKEQQTSIKILQETMYPRRRISLKSRRKGSSDTLKSPDEHGGASDQKELQDPEPTEINLEPLAAEDPPASPERKPAKYSTTPQRTRCYSKCTILENWIIKPVVKFGKTKLTVHGQRREDEAGVFWFTSSIKERLGPMLLATASGSRYQLRGNMDLQTAQLLSDLPLKTLKAFQFGFPSNWETLLENKTMHRSRSRERNQSKTPDEVKQPAVAVQDDHVGNQKDQDARLSVHKQKKGEDARLSVLKQRKDEDARLSVHKQKKDEDARLSVNKQKKRQSRKSFKDIKAKASVSEPELSKTIIAEKTVDQSGDRSLLQMPKTRSGRRVIPPLDWWRGERLQVPNDDAEITLIEGTPDYQIMLTEKMKQSQKKSKLRPVRNKSSKKPPQCTVSDTECDIRKALAKKAEKTNNRKDKTRDKNKTIQDCTPRLTLKTKSIKNTVKISEKEKDNKVQKKVSKKTVDKVVVCPSENDGKKLSKRKPERPRQPASSLESTATVPLEVLENEKENKTDKEWTKVEIKNLNKAMRGIHPNAVDYWSFISEFVRTRTEQECIDFHNRGAVTAPTKKQTHKIKETTKTKVTEPSQITGGKRTLKRKRQFQELLAHRDEGYDDDFFDSTPYRKMQPQKIPRLSADDSFDEFYGNAINFETPMNVKLDKERYAVSEKKSTFDAPMFSPAVLEQADNNLDQYVHRIKHGKHSRKTPLRPKHVASPASSKHTHDMPPIASLFAEAATNPINDNDYDDEEEDYYYSD